MKPYKSCLLALALSAGLAACGPATQNIPVSTNPGGAQVFADGNEVCPCTPCNIELEKTQAHVLTFTKEGYKQADVQISRKYDAGAVARGATQSGLNSGSMGASTAGAVTNALFTASSMEENGDAYVLSPSSVIVHMVPEGKAGKSRLVSEKEAAKIETTETPTMGGALEKDGLKAAEGALEAGAAAAPTVGTNKKWKKSNTSYSQGKDGSVTKTTRSSSASVGVSVNPAEAGLEALKYLEGEAEGKGEE